MSDQNDPSENLKKSQAGVAQNLLDLIDNNRRPHHDNYQAPLKPTVVPSAKRAFDIVVSSALLFALKPKLKKLEKRVEEEMGLPIHYYQQRKSGGQTIQVKKLRSMLPLKKGQTVGNRADDEARLTDFGREIRNKRYDELFQLENVKKGDMSMVGPRTLLTHHTFTPSKLAPGFRSLRNSFIGGFTSAGFAYGLSEDSQERTCEVKPDKTYIESVLNGKWSPFTDLAIISDCIIRNKYDVKRACPDFNKTSGIIILAGSLGLIAKAVYKHEIKKEPIPPRPQA